MHYVEPLKVFVSGREKELANERDAIREGAEQLCFRPVSSESRGAQSRPVDEAYLSEIRDSDIYIGIFAREYSEPSKREFEEARSQNIPTLIYEQELGPGDSRDEQLSDFLREIKQPGTGVTVGAFRLARELREQVKRDLVNVLSESFREARRQKTRQESVQQVATATDSIVRWAVPKTAKLNVPFQVSATFSGSAKNGFLDLWIQGPNRKSQWCPDPHSWNAKSDLGVKHLRDEEYSSTWQVTVTGNRSDVGQYSYHMGMYDDVDGLPNRNRKLIAKSEGTFSVEE